MKRNRNPKGSLRKHSLSLAALAVVVLLIVLYRRSNPDTHIGAFFGNASQRRLQGGRTIPHVSKLSMFQKLFGTWALLVWFPMAVLAFVLPQWFGAMKRLWQ
jgi:hypothetical protein